MNSTTSKISAPVIPSIRIASAERLQGAGLSDGRAPKPDDLSLMRAIAAGDAPSLGLLYDRHSPLLYAICRRILRDAGDAEDILIDIFFEVWSRSDRFDAGRGTPLTYLVTLTRSRALDRQRSRSARPHVTSNGTDNEAQTSAASDPLNSTDLTEQGAIVRKALSELDPDQREALECAFYEGLSHSEIAEKLRKPLGTIKTYIRQGLIRLRVVLRSNK